MTNCLDTLQRWFVSGVSRPDYPDLSARQTAVLLTVYQTDGPHTVRGLATALNVSKPAITRALDRLGDLDLARRKVDPLDRRSVLVQKTANGTSLLRRMQTDWQTAEHPPQRSAAAATPAPQRAHG